MGLTLSLTAFALGFFSFAFRGKLLDEGGTRLDIDHLGIGYYVWELAFLLIVLSCTVKLLNTNNYKNS